MYMPPKKKKVQTVKIPNARGDLATFKTDTLNIINYYLYHRKNDRMLSLMYFLDKVLNRLRQDYPNFRTALSKKKTALRKKKDTASRVKKAIGKTIGTKKKKKVR